MENKGCLFTKEDWDFWYDREDKEQADKIKRRIEYSRCFCPLCQRSFVHRYSLRSHLAWKFRDIMGEL